MRTLKAQLEQAERVIEKCREVPAGMQIVDDALRIATSATAKLSRERAEESLGTAKSAER